jgi:alcohol dehydrogenase, propanol-preferring
MATVDSVPIPVPGEGEVLVRIHCCGVCHTDVHACDGDFGDGGKALPLVCGHEGVGRVAAIGTGVKTVQLGDRVGIAWLHSACLTCEFCLSGWETLCTQQKQAGFSTDGCLSEYGKRTHY